MKINSFIIGISLFTLLLSCNKDDDNGVESVPVRDKAEVYAEDIAEIETYLRTHFYNFEDFDFNDIYNPKNDAIKIKFDTISGPNANKTPLIDQVESKTVTDGDGFEFKLYFLKVREGLGEQLVFTDRAHLIYEGSRLDGFVFDNSTSTVPFDLITDGSTGGVITGFREGLIEFKTSTSFTTNSNGTVSYTEFGIGAVFIPSGLGYFSAIQADIPAYSPLIFKYDLMQRNERDHDGDGVASQYEDLNGNGNVFDDDTDGDNIPNFIDLDDDNDGVPTLEEDIDCDGDPSNDDTNGNGTPNYLDSTVFRLKDCD